ncbi:MAG TPA: YdeI/OmpD-associated family protein [Candidatus Dormibacteraeota bacterium]
MRAAGLAEVERARSDGRWAAAYAGPAAIEVPADLQAALDASPQAAEVFGRFTRSPVNNRPTAGLLLFPACRERSTTRSIRFAGRPSSTSRSA